MTHTNDYCVETVQDIEELGQRVDDLRLEAMAALEELDQLLIENRAMAERTGWNVQNIQDVLTDVVDKLRKQV